VCIKFLALIGLLFSSLSFGGEVYDKFPNKINAKEILVHQYINDGEFMIFRKLRKL
jgi:hypothetical protein